MKLILSVVSALWFVPMVSAEILYDERYKLEVYGEKIYREIHDRIEVPHDEYIALPRYEMGKGPIPVSLDRVVELADRHFKKTLNVAFSDEEAHIHIELRQRGDADKTVWWYYVRFRPRKEISRSDPDHWYQLGIPMNGKIYAATFKKELVADQSDALKESGIPFLRDGKRSDLNPIEKEMQRLAGLPGTTATGHAGVYMMNPSGAVMIFYPDGHLFQIHTLEHDLYKVDAEGKVYTTYMMGPDKDRLMGDKYIGVFREGMFIADQGDYAVYYLLKEPLSDGSKPETASKPKAR